MIMELMSCLQYIQVLGMVHIMDACWEIFMDSGILIPPARLHFSSILVAEKHYFVQKYWFSGLVVPHLVIQGGRVGLTSYCTTSCLLLLLCAIVAASLWN